MSTAATRRVLIVDAAIAVVLATTAVTEVYVSFSVPERRWGAVALLAVENLALVVRRWRPLLAWAIAGAAVGAYGLGPYDDPWLHYGAMVALYSVAAHTPRRTARTAGIATLVYIVAVLLADWGRSDAVDWTSIGVTAAAAWLLGDNVRTARAYAAEMHARAEDAERRRHDEARRAVAEERLRLARELHDVTAHHVSVIAVQAEAGQALLPDRPREVAEVLDRVATSAREALTDLRRVLGVLRDDSDARRPQPGLDRLPALADEVRAAGLPVALRVEGEAQDGVALASTVDVSGYRIVQEALTNVLRHAPGAPTDVVVRYGPTAVEIEVSNDAVTPVSAVDTVDTGAGASRRSDGHGHGLTGMRERAVLLGGRFDAGRRDGRFVVRALLPR